MHRSSRLTAVADFKHDARLKYRPAGPASGYAPVVNDMEVK